MNTCDNCKYRSGYKFDFCNHPDNGIDPVSGDVQPRLCVFARSHLNGICGPTGDLFEPIEPPPLTRWQRIKALFTRAWPW